MFANLFRSRRTPKTVRQQPGRTSVRLSLETFEDRLLLATFNWFEVMDGNFNDPARWRDQAGNPGVPGPDDTANISLGGVVNVTVTGAHAVNRIFSTSSRLLINAGASVTLANQAEGSRIAQLVLNGTLRTTGGTTLLAENSTLRGTLDTTTAGATLAFTGGTHQLDAGVAFTGPGLVYLGAAVNVNVPLTVSARVELAPSGNLGGPSTFTHTGPFTWSGGGMSGEGQTTLAAGSSLTLTGADQKFLDGRTLTTRVNTTVTGTGRLAAGNSAVWNNAAGTVLDVQSDADFIYAFGSQPALTFNNAGTFRKSAGTTTDFSIGTIFNNTGAVQVQAGALALAAGTASSGIAVSAGANLLFFGQTYTLAPGSSLSGAGVTQIVSNGTVNVTGIVTATNFTLTTSGSLTGPGTLAVSGAFLWTGGGMSGTGTTTVGVGGALTVDSGSEKFLGQRRLNTLGTTTILPTATGRFALGDGAIWTNGNAATFDVQSEADFIYAFGTAPALTFNNVGIFRKSAGAATDFTNGTVFNNTGTVEVTGGILSLATGTGSGGFDVSAGAVLAFPFGGQTYTLAAGSALGGAGVTRIGANATINVTDGVPATNVALAGGAISGTGTLSIIDTLLWTSGGMGGAGTTIVEVGGTLTLDGTTEKFLGQRTLNTLGNTTVLPTGTGRLALGDGAVWNNAGILDVQSDADFVYVFGVAPALTLNNTGTFRKSAGAATTFTDQVILNNTGTVEVVNGTLELSRGTSTGTFDVAATGVLRFTTSTHILNTGAAFTGDGFSRVAGGALNVAGDVTALNFGLDSGTLTGPGTLTVGVYLDWTGGTMADTNGVTRLDAAATMAINGNAGKAVDGRTLILDGTTQWYDSGSISLSNNATINNNGFLDIAHLTDLGMTGSGILNNVGFLLKAGPGRTTFGVTLSNNGGFVGVYEGSLAVAGAYNQNAGSTEVYATLAATGGVDVRAGDFVLLGQITGNVTVSGVSAVLHGSGTITGSLVNGGIIHVGGVGAAGTLTVGGNFTQQGLGVLNMELGGLTAGTEYDQLRVIGSSTLGGTLNVELINGFAVSAGNTFRVLQTGSRSGTFAVLNLAAIAPLTWNPQYDANGLTLAAG